MIAEQSQLSHTAGDPTALQPVNVVLPPMPPRMGQTQDVSTNTGPVQERRRLRAKRANGETSPNQNQETAGQNKEMNMRPNMTPDMMNWSKMNWTECVLK